MPVNQVFGFPSLPSRSFCLGLVTIVNQLSRCFKDIPLGHNYGSYSEVGGADRYQFPLLKYSTRKLSSCVIPAACASRAAPGLLAIPRVLAALELGVDFSEALSRPSPAALTFKGSDAGFKCCHSHADY